MTDLAKPVSRRCRDQFPLGPVIYSYTRAQAVADGVQVEVSAKARQAGISPACATKAPPTRSQIAAASP